MIRSTGNTADLQALRAATPLLEEATPLAEPRAAEITTTPPIPAPASELERVNQAIAPAAAALRDQQVSDGHWCYELEADCTIPSEYVLMNHFMDEREPELETRIGRYLRRRQDGHGGWSLYPGSCFDLSCSVKSYWALKLIGDDPDAEHMRRAREAILEHGGAAQCNVFTRIALAMFGQIPWRGTPFVPVEIMLLPSWSPFHLSKVSYWSRTVMVPLAVLCSLRAKAANPTGIDIRELFVTPPEQERRYFHVRSPLNRAFLGVERLARHCESLIPGRLRRKALAAAEAWIIERLNGDDGLGGIFPAMVNAHESLALLGYAADHPLRRQTRAALHKLLVEQDDEAYCQPCLSPIWDTALAALTLQEVERGESDEDVTRALDWLLERQVTDLHGDYAQRRPEAPPGGWAFQYQNPHYPDLDDSAMVGWAMLRAKRPERYGESVRLAADWIRAMQSRSGGFAAFDADNTYFYLNEIPFADHGALLDPPTSDVSAGCLRFLTALGRAEDDATRAECLDFLRREQEEDGCWFGRWGTNYIYGCWAVLLALGELGCDQQDPMITRAVAWLESHQHDDGGWGESNDSYLDRKLAGTGSPSTSFQTAWALIGLLAVGRQHSQTVRRGIDYLLRHQTADGLWYDSWFTAPGFPRVFYLKYHGYDKFFPLWALARYRNLMEAEGSIR